MKKSSTKLAKNIYYATEENERFCKEYDERDFKPIDEMPPIIGYDGGRFYATLPDFNEAPEKYFEFPVAEEDDGQSSLVLISRGDNLLPSSIRSVVQENGWTCLSFRHIDKTNSSSEKIIIGIYYDEYGKFTIEDCIAPCGTCTTIYIMNGSYTASYNGYVINIFGEDVFKCSTLTNGSGNLSIVYDDERGMNFLRQFLTHNAANLHKE
jgi:hypothetical protein